MIEWIIKQNITSVTSQARHLEQCQLRRIMSQVKDDFQHSLMPTMEDLTEEFKEVYKDKGAHDLSSQIKYLAALGDYYHQRGAEISDWVCLLKAHTLYNSVAVREKEKANTWSYKAFEVQQTFWKTRGLFTNFSYQQQKAITSCIKEKLSCLRKNTQSRINDVTANHTAFNCDPAQLSGPHNSSLCKMFIDSMEQISNFCTRSMIALFSHVVEYAVGIIGRPPCNFCAAGLGSLARGEMTPYSDLEFFFLTEKSSSETTAYFENLALTVYFLVGNLKETKLKYMAIEELGSWFDDITSNGIKIDGLQKSAGNIPTGNGSQEQYDHLLGTVDQLVGRYKTVFDNPDPEKSSRGDYSAVLSSSVFICGDINLLLKFQARIKTLEPNTKRHEASHKMMARDINSYNFYPSFTMNQTLNVKRDIYRYPSILILNLKIVYQLFSLSPLAAINELMSRGLFSKYMAFCLKFSFSCALYMRLSAYLHHQSQNESISVLSSESDVVPERQQWFVSRRLLLMMMRHLMPLKRNIATAAWNAVLENDETTDLECVTFVSYYCGDYSACYDTLQKINLNEDYNHSLRHIFIHSAYECCHYDEALESGKSLLHRLQQQCTDTNDPKMSLCYLLLGITSVTTGAYRQAEKWLLKSLQISENNFGKESAHEAIAESYCALAALYQNQNKLLPALANCLKSVEMYKRLRGDCDQLGLANTYNWLGMIYFRLTNDDKAEENYWKCLKMIMRLYGQCDLPIIAKCYGNIGGVRIRKGDVTQALTYHMKSLEMHTRLIRKRDHLDIATSYLNLGHVFTHLKQYGRALEFYKDSLNMCDRLSVKVCHPVIIQLHKNLTNLHVELQQYQQALLHLIKLQEAQKQLYEASDHEDLTDVYASMGNTYLELKQYDEAKECFSLGIEMCKRLYGETDHGELVTYCSKLRIKQYHYNQPTGYTTETLQYSHRLSDNSDSTRVANGYHSIALLHTKNLRFGKAFFYIFKSLNMRLRLSKADVFNVDVLKSYELLAQTYLTISAIAKLYKPGDIVIIADDWSNIEAEKLKNS